MAELPRLRQFVRWYLLFSVQPDTSRVLLLNHVLPSPGPERQEFLAGMSHSNISRVGYVTLNPHEAQV